MRNADLYAAFAALVELGEATKPKGGQPPVIAPLPASVAFRFALNRNHLQPLALTIEEQRAALRQQYGLDGEPVLDSHQAREDYRARLKSFETDMAAMLNQEVEDWHAPAPIKLAQLGDRQVPDAWLAAWAAVGIVVDGQ